ncbi:MAG: histone H1-like repetitive region-containing protein [Bacteroidia bacterium]|nr:histone H1-like repetitive region-containing protein [Bacteroidia bacterium]
MPVKVSLKNSDKKAILDEHVYEKLNQDKNLKTIKFWENLREHSSGYVFFQKNWRQKDGSYRNETIYLHKLISEKFVKKPAGKVRWFVRFINANAVDCRLENLEWSTFSNLVRNTRKIKNSTGYRGVVKQGRKFYSYIYVDRKGIPLGSFDTAEQAAAAYNKKSTELFGKTNTLNVISKKTNVAAKVAPKAKVVAKKAAPKKVVAKKAVAKKVVAKKAVAKKAVAKKVVAKKAVAKKVVAKKAVAKKAVAKKVVAKKAVAKKVVAKKAVAKKVAPKAKAVAKKVVAKKVVAKKAVAKKVAPKAKVVAKKKK